MVCSARKGSPVKKTIFVVLLVVLLTAVAPFATAQDTAQATAPSSSPDASFNPLQDAGKVAQAARTAATDVAKDSSGANKDKYQTYAAIIALIGALTSLLPKLLESASLVSKTRNELQRIEDLADLIQKIQAESVLSPATMDSVKVQLEAEIMLAVEGLEKSRERRLQNKVKQYELGLSYQRRLFLLYRPVGFRAWVAHFFAYAMLIYGFVMALDAAHSYRFDGGQWVSAGYHWKTFFTNDGWLILLSFLMLAWLFRMWALWERRPNLQPDRHKGVVKVTGLRRRVARHALSRATIYAARARHSARAAERLCLYTWRVTRWRS